MMAAGRGEPGPVGEVDPQAGAIVVRSRFRGRNAGTFGRDRG